ncbi:hypothetical protein JRO89_XS04G0230200 [Xanthoceras sorbifolium]|uniref:Uncharacterized protein n=1 Tax=Xanthoceras sorbifolium TaxID=99658 RepID=A0ABQ8I6L7_9ROSI|nr:hypothetical protein JRO89_XS04G0230200 [Xanthoceras sorbifolium]
MPPQAWKMLDEKVMSSVELHLSGEVICNIMEENSTKGTWEKLEKLYMGKSYEEDDKALLLLRSLLDSFKRFRGTLLFGKNTLKYDTVVSDIISYVKMNKASEWEA